MRKPSLQIDAASFLSRHWQREHLLIAGGMAPFGAPADANELAGLAMEDEVDSRIVCQRSGHWHQDRGPFGDEDFERSEPWTLLVQSVDQHWDEAAELLFALPFLPQWRLDDVMMSYANDRGSAGPHYDNYDVFIIQGEGQRRWQIGQRCDNDTALLENTDLRLLASFECEQEYVMNTGDVLYIPPGVAHWGISIGESTSFSIGLRAPRLSDLLARWIDNRLTSVEDDWLLADPSREVLSRVGEISGQDLQRARLQLLALLDDEDDPRWFGETVTAVGSGTGWRDDSGDLAEVTAKSCLLRCSGSRLAWHLGEGVLWVFSQGQSRSFPLQLQSLLEALCGAEQVSAADALASHDQAAALLRWLLDEGTVMLSD